MTIHLYVYVPVSRAVEDGSSLAGLFTVQLSSSDVARILDEGCSEAAAPYLSTPSDLADVRVPGVRGLEVTRLAFDAILGALTERRDRIRRIREEAGHLVVRLGSPSQIKRHARGALPDIELLELEDADAFMGLPAPLGDAPACGHVWSGRRGAILPDPQVPGFVVDPDSGWSTVDASRLWCLIGAERPDLEASTANYR